jgi:Mg/Co/Ni transporter MgtE
MEPHTVGPDTRLEEVARLLQVYQIDQVPVINDQSVVVGLIDIQDCMMDFTVKHTTMLNHKAEPSIGL